MIETVAIAVKKATQKLAAHQISDVSGIEAQALMLDCLELSDQSQIQTRAEWTLEKTAGLKFESHIKRRLAGEPVAYILGRREFYEKQFFTTPAALIPRPESEGLVDVALAHIPANKKRRVLDMGTGCGAVGLSIALLREYAEITLSDVIEDTLTLAKQNTARLEAQNVRFVLGDWYEPLKDKQAFSLIVSNPPYIADNDPHLKRGDIRYEPPVALLGGADGLSALSKVITGAPKLLQRGGILITEHGQWQKQAVAALFAKAGFCGIHSIRDLAGIERIIFGVKP